MLFRSHDAFAENKSVLAEGAQGSLLDIDFGSYPFVTSSSTVCAGACTGLGIAPNKIGNVIGIFKAYCTRVGSGPFPTELNDETGEKLRQLGNEFGSTTGRPRRCGWIDLVALQFACMINGVTQLIMTKADVMDSLDTLHWLRNSKTSLSLGASFSSRSSVSLSKMATMRFWASLFTYTIVIPF